MPAFNFLTFVHMRPLIINFTPTGMIPTREMTPFVPITPSEIIEQVHEVNELGITLAHLHARDEDNGLPTWDPDIYQKIMEGVRKHCPELVVCLSLSGRNFNTFEKRSAALDLLPDMGSLTLSSLNFSRQASVNSPDMVQQLAQAMLDRGIHPELEAFDLGMINYAHYLIKKKLLQPPYYFNLLFNNIAGMQTDLMHIGMAVKELPGNAYWAVAGLGTSQLNANVIAMAAGGGVRIGLEDNIYFDHNRERLATNYQLVKRIHDLAEILQRPVMTSKAFGDLGFYRTQHATQPDRL